MIWMKVGGGYLYLRTVAGDSDSWNRTLPEADIKDLRLGIRPPITFFWQKQKTMFDQ